MHLIRKVSLDPDSAIESLMNNFHVTSVMWRLVELKVYQNHDFEAPLLDLGCGEGAFASELFAEPIDIGMDISKRDIRKAAQYDLYKHLTVASGTVLPFKNSQFNTILSNCVLEHIPDIDTVLSECNRVLDTGGFFYFTVPSVYFKEYLFYPRLFKALGLFKLSKFYGKKVDEHIKHYFYFSSETWEEKLRIHNFTLVECESFISPYAIRFMDLMNFTKMLININLMLFGKRSVFIPRRLVTSIFKGLILKEFNREVDKGAALFIKAQKVSS